MPMPEIQPIETATQPPIWIPWVKTTDTPIKDCGVKIVFNHVTLIKVKFVPPNALDYSWK